MARKCRLTLLFGVFLMAGILVSSCTSQLSFRFIKEKALAQRLAAYEPQYPAVKFMVLSDPHYYDPHLGIEGKAFAEYLDQDRKLIALSREILEEALAMVLAEKPTFLIIPGDLTKDGEKHNHEALAHYLNKLRQAGIKIYVVPGNHDVKNGHSLRYEGDQAYRIPNITASDFALIYADYGYAEAIWRDSHSLSYVVEPVSGLWLVGLDACLYQLNQEDQEPHTGGQFSQATIDWLETVLEEAVAQKKAVIAFLHHGVVAHYKSQPNYFPDYLVKDWPQVARLLASYKVRLAFSGHYHAQDISLWRDQDIFLFDIETGSLVTYPCPLRIVTINSTNQCRLETKLIETIPSLGKNFANYARTFLAEGIEKIAQKTMKELGVPESDFEILAPQIAEAFLAHYMGDENLPPGKSPLKTTGLSFMGSLVVGNRRALVEDLWQDLPPPDNNLLIELNKGKWSEP